MGNCPPRFLASSCVVVKLLLLHACCWMPSRTFRADPALRPSFVSLPDRVFLLVCPQGGYVCRAKFVSCEAFFFFFFFFLDFCATCNRYTFIMPTLIKKYSLRRLSLLSQLKYSAVMYCNVAYVSFSCRRLEHCDGEAMSFAGGILFSLQ